MSNVHDQESFFKAVLDGLRYTHRIQRKTRVSYTTPRQLYRAATSKTLKMYAQHNERQIRRRLKANRFEMNGVPMEVNRKVLLQMYKKRKNNGTLVPTDDEYTATSTVIGHPIYVYIESPKGLVLKQHMQPERQEITGSPIVLTQDEKGRFTLDAKRTQHWSLYGAIAAVVSTTPERLYDDVKKATMAAIRENPDSYRPWFITHLETSPRINYTKNVISTYLRQYKNTFLATVNQVEMQALANVLQRAITVETPTGVVRVVPTQGTEDAPPLEIKIQGGRHYMIIDTPRPSTHSDQQHKIETLINVFDRVTTHNTTTHASDPDEDETSVPDMEDLLKRYAKLHDIDFDDLELDEAKVRAEELIDDMPQQIDTIQREYEKYIRDKIETPDIPDTYRLDTTGRKTPSSNVSRNVDFTGLSPEEARFIRDFEKELDPTHAESIQRQFDAYMAQYQGPNREAETASSISERLEDLRNAAANVHTPQEARRLDTEIHNATSDVVQYIETHHPDAMSQLIDETTPSPSLVTKVARHRPSRGDALGLGTLVIGGLSLVSSYASAWRMFG
jgi:hypothetical protein